MIKKIFINIFLIAAVLTLLSPTKVSAHLGNGPPFLQVDNAYAQTNPYYEGPVTLNVPLDLVSNNFLPNQPINFRVVISRLQNQTFTPPGFFKNVTFRWSYDGGDNFDQSNGEYQYGNSAPYSFPHPQSYLIVLEAKSPLDQGFVVIDNVQINVVPSMGYKLPQPSLFIGTNALDPVKTVHLVSRPGLDPSVTSAHYLWDFGEGKLEGGKGIDHSFSGDIQKTGEGLIYNRVVDSNGLVADTGLQVENTKGKLNFHPFGNMTAVPVSYGTYAQSLASNKKNPALTSQKSSSFPIYLPLSAVAFIVLMLLIRILRTRKKPISR